jgi:hypothetical protein
MAFLDGEQMIIRRGTEDVPILMRPRGKLWLFMVRLWH